jgi:hypothetical protein
MILIVVRTALRGWRRGPALWKRLDGARRRRSGARRRWGRARGHRRPSRRSSRARRWLGRAQLRCRVGPWRLGRASGCSGALGSAGRPRRRDQEHRPAATAHLVADLVVGKDVARFARGAMEADRHGPTPRVEAFGPRQLRCCLVKPGCIGLGSRTNYRRVFSSPEQGLCTGAIHAKDRCRHRPCSQTD